MNTIIVRLFGPDEYDFYDGSAADCPPIPRVGESVIFPSGKGIVERVEYTMEEILPGKMKDGTPRPGYNFYKVAVHLR
jgi:hypothetical protein